MYPSLKYDLETALALGAMIFLAVSGFVLGLGIPFVLIAWLGKMLGV